MSGIWDLFDLNGDGRLDGIEIAFAYSVIFDDGESQENDRTNIDVDYDEEE